MVEKNQHFVAYRPMDCGWLYTGRISARTVSRTASEVLDICGYVFSAFEPIYTPQEIYCNFLGFTEDHPSATIFDVSPAETATREFNAEEGHRYEQFREHVEQFEFDDVPVTSVYRIDFASGRTKIRLGDRDIEISRDATDNYRRWLHDEVSEKPPSTDPLSISIYQYRLSETKAPVYTIDIETATDIWFEETPTGEVNRLRFGKALTTLKEKLDLIRFEVYSDTFDDERLLSVLVDE